MHTQSIPLSGQRLYRFLSALISYSNYKSDTGVQSSKSDSIHPWACTDVKLGTPHVMESRYLFCAILETTKSINPLLNWAIYNTTKDKVSILLSAIVDSQRSVSQTVWIVWIDGVPPAVIRLAHNVRSAQVLPQLGVAECELTRYYSVRP